MAIKSFKLRLRKVKGADVGILDSVYDYLPATGARERIIEAIRSSFARHVGKEVAISLDAVHRENFSSFASKLSRQDAVAIFGMEPMNKKAVCDIDPLLAAIFVERLLGGEGSGRIGTHSLSDTEQGVLQYLILQIMAAVYKAGGSKPRVHFRFDRFVSSEKDLRDIAGADDGVVVLVFRLAVGRFSGFIRLALPDPFIETSFANVRSEADATPEEFAHVLQDLERFHFVRTHIFAEAGRTELSPSELGQLEEGDVVIMDKGELGLADGGLYGKVVLKFGRGDEGGLAAEVSQEKRHIKCKVVGVIKGE